MPTQRNRNKTHYPGSILDCRKQDFRSCWLPSCKRVEIVAQNFFQDKGVFIIPNEVHTADQKYNIINKKCEKNPVTPILVTRYAVTPITNTLLNVPSCFVVTYILQYPVYTIKVVYRVQPSWRLFLTPSYFDEPLCNKKISSFCLLTMKLYRQIEH